jgi:hypothetical protein
MFGHLCMLAGQSPMCNDFPMSVLSNATSVFLSTKRSSVSVVLIRFFPRFFLGLAFCDFLSKVRFFITARPDRVLQRRVRRFSSEMRKKMLVKKKTKLRCGIPVLVSLHPALIGRGGWRVGPLALHCSVKGYFWSPLHVGRSIPKCTMISRWVSCRTRLASSCLQNHPRPMTNAG